MVPKQVLLSEEICKVQLSLSLSLGPLCGVVSFVRELMRAFSEVAGFAFWSPQKQETLRRVLKEDAVTHLTVSTSLFHAVSDFSLPGLRTVITGGEKLKKPQYERFQRKHPDTCIFNTYGPTETTVIASLHKCELNEGRDLPIGKPIHGTSIYVAKGVQLCPVGVAGEVYIGGAGVSPGYLGAEANNEAFQKDLSDGSRYMFRTGDLARWLPDGNLEFVSRVGKGQVSCRQVEM